MCPSPDRRPPAADECARASPVVTPSSSITVSSRCHGLNQPTKPSTSLAPMPYARARRTPERRRDLDRIDAVRDHHHVVGRHALPHQDLLHGRRHDDGACRVAADPAFESVGQAAQHQLLVRFLLVGERRIDLEHHRDAAQPRHQDATDIEKRIALVQHVRTAAARGARTAPTRPRCCRPSSAHS